MRLFEGSASSHASTGEASVAQTLTSAEKLLAQEASSVSIYPNPTREVVTVTGSGFTAGRSVNVSVVDVLGNTVMTAVHTAQNSNVRVSVDMSRLPSGTYTMLLTDGVVRRTVRCSKVD